MVPLLLPFRRCMLASKVINEWILAYARTTRISLFNSSTTTWLVIYNTGEFVEMMSHELCLPMEQVLGRWHPELEESKKFGAEVRAGFSTYPMYSATLAGPSSSSSSSSSSSPPGAFGGGDGGGGGGGGGGSGGGGGGGSLLTSAFPSS